MSRTAKEIRGWLGVLISAVVNCPDEFASEWKRLTSKPEKHINALVWLVQAQGMEAQGDRRWKNKTSECHDVFNSFAAAALFLWLVLFSPPMDGTPPIRAHAIRTIATWPQFTTHITALARGGATLSPRATEGDTSRIAAAILCMAALMELGCCSRANAGLLCNPLSSSDLSDFSAVAGGYVQLKTMGRNDDILSIAIAHVCEKNQSSNATTTCSLFYPGVELLESCLATILSDLTLEQKQPSTSVTKVRFFFSWLRPPGPCLENS